MLLRFRFSNFRSFRTEQELSLIALLSIQLIRLFNNTSTNPRGAQLIFNTHDTNLLSSGVLRRDQIWFTEKKADGSSQRFPLIDFKPRRTENLENGYLQGRYGAIPFVNPDGLLVSIRGSGCQSTHRTITVVRWFNADHGD